MVLPLLAGLAVGAMGMKAADKSADAMTRSADQASDITNSMFQQGRRDARPFMDVGLGGMNALAYLSGVGERPNGYSFELTPASQIMMNQGVGAIEAGAAGRGNLFSGSTVGALEGMRADTVQMDRNNQMNWLGQLMASGQAAQAGQAAAGANYSARAGDIAMQQGNAQASGIMGGYNALTGGLQNGLQMQFMNREMQNSPYGNGQGLF